MCIGTSNKPTHTCIYVYMYQYMPFYVPLFGLVYVYMHSACVPLHVNICTLVLVCVFYVIITRVHHSKKYYRYRCIFIRICVHSRMYSCICISSKPLNPHIHVYTNMRSLLWSEGCFLRTSIVVSNSLIHLYTQIRICLYVSWTEWVGPLRYSLIRSYWLSQTGQSAQNRSVVAY